MSQSKAGSVLGGALLITGSCIGVGMLALPILTGIAGFFPSLVIFFIAWAFMTTTALFMVEVLGWFEKPVNLISMVSLTLGPLGKVLCWILYLFLFYALLVAYMVASGSHVVAFAHNTFSWVFPHWAGSLFFVILFGCLVYLGTRPVDMVNRGLMFGKIAAYIGLILFGVGYVTPKLLTYIKLEYALFPLPVLIISFGFHNMVPSLMSYMDGNRRRVKKAIFAGSVLTLVIYFFWELIALGVLPIQGSHGIHESYIKGIDAAQSLKSYLGSTAIGYCAQLLAFFAILTSFLAQSLSLVHFLRDGFKLKKRKDESENPWLCLFAMVPPLIFALLFPNLFFKALDFAGGICAVVLFGVMPVLMVWIGRYQKGYLIKDRVWGGKGVLLLVLLFACFVFFYQLSCMLGFSIFPHLKA